MTPAQLQQLIYENRYGKTVLRCIQCGTCSASCPLSGEMDHAPRELFALMRDGQVDDVLNSNTPWFCVSCYQCMVRCPQEIPVTDVMYQLKQICVEYAVGRIPSKMGDLYRAFAAEVRRHGRISEARVMARYGRRHPADMLNNLTVGINLMTRGRLELRSPRIRRPANMSQLLSSKK